MVVLASSIVTKTGKALVSRQFIEMSRVRIEGLLAAFPKLVGSGKQHTYIETENVRYVYQPMEALYLLLVTNKGSNILEDLETLRLLAKVVPEYVESLDEEGIEQAAFSLLFAFDEVISLGYKENVTVQQVKQNTEMESHEEKLHKMIIQSKINDTKDVMKRKAIEIDKQKLDREARARESKVPAYVPSVSSVSAGGRSPMHNDDNTPTYSKPEPSYFGKAEAKKGPSKGMQLGKAKKGANDFLDSLRAEGEMVDTNNGYSKDSAPAAAGHAAVKAANEPLSIVAEEKIRVVLSNNGGLEEMEINGTIFLQAASEEDAFVRVAIKTGANKGYSFKTHPNIDKQMYSQQNVLGLKDPERPFPSGSPVGILKWRMQTRDQEAEVPLTINCWPSTSGGDSYVNIEYECNVGLDLHDVTIAIPLPPLSSAPRINQVEGDTHYDGRKGQLLWTIDLLDDSNRSGALEFVVPACNPDAFLPVHLNFSSQQTLCDLSVLGVTNTRTDAPAKYKLETQLTSDGYEIV
jgi:hypothetical protein